MSKFCPRPQNRYGELIWSNFLLFSGVTMISTPFIDKCRNSVPGPKIDMRTDLVEFQMSKFCPRPQNRYMRTDLVEFPSIQWCYIDMRTDLVEFPSMISTPFI